MPFYTCDAQRQTTKLSNFCWWFLNEVQFLMGNIYRENRQMSFQITVKCWLLNNSNFYAMSVRVNDYEKQENPRSHLFRQFQSIKQILDTKSKNTFSLVKFWVLFFIYYAFFLSDKMTSKICILSFFTLRLELKSEDNAFHQMCVFACMWRRERVYTWLEKKK